MSHMSATLHETVGDGGTSTNFPDGLGGSSTGTSINFQSGSSAPPPASVVISTPLTGDAAAQASASLSTQLAQASGSMGLYSLTTGGAIAGISTGLPGGYDQEASMSMAMSDTLNSGDAAGPSILQLDSTLTWIMATTAGLIGALVVL